MEPPEPMADSDTALEVLKDLWQTLKKSGIEYGTDLYIAFHGIAIAKTMMTPIKSFVPTKHRRFIDNSFYYICKCCADIPKYGQKYCHRCGRELIWNFPDPELTKKKRSKKNG